MGTKTGSWQRRSWRNGYVALAGSTSMTTWIEFGPITTKTRTISSPGRTIDSPLMGLWTVSGSPKYLPWYDIKLIVGLFGLTFRLRSDWGVWSSSQCHLRSEDSKGREEVQASWRKRWWENEQRGVCRLSASRLVSPSGHSSCLDKTTEVKLFSIIFTVHKPTR